MSDRARRGWLLLAMVLCATACGSDADDRVTGAPVSTGQVPTPAAERFCASWVELVKTDDDARATELLRDPPPEIADAVGVILESESAGDTNDEAVGEVMAWVEVNCTDSGQPHVAPPVGADLAGLAVCSAGTPPPVPEVSPGDDFNPDDVVLFGEADRADPYDGPMIGLFSSKLGEGGHTGDGDRTPITVRGNAGEAAPFTVFQQTIIPELGTVIAWTEGGRDIGLYGRLWTKERTGELVALANRLELVDGHLAFPAGEPPEGYKQVFAGSTDAYWSIIGTGLFGGEYYVRYQPRDEVRGQLTLAGLRLTAEQFDTFRFFAFPIARVRIGEHDALFGSLWSENDGPYVATWRQPDGLTVRILGIGNSGRDQVRAVAEQSRDLDRAEWVKLVESAENCKTAIP